MLNNSFYNLSSAKTTSAFAAILFVIFALHFSVFSQYNPVLDEQRERAEKEELENKVKELTKRAQPDLAILDEFLPSTKDSWAISIFSSGGILGGSRIVSAVNSDGKSLCSNEVEIDRDLQNKVYFIQLRDLLNITNFDLLNLTQKNLSFICSDCPVTTITFSNRRQLSAIRTYQFSTVSHLIREGELKVIFDKVIKTANCD